MKRKRYPLSKTARKMLRLASLRYGFPIGYYPVPPSVASLNEAGLIYPTTQLFTYKITTWGQRALARGWR